MFESLLPNKYGTYRIRAENETKDTPRQFNWGQINDDKIATKYGDKTVIKTVKEKDKNKHIMYWDENWETEKNGETTKKKLRKTHIELSGIRYHYETLPLR